MCYERRMWGLRVARLASKLGRGGNWKNDAAINQSRPISHHSVIIHHFYPYLTRIIILNFLLKDHVGTGHYLHVKYNAYLSLRSLRYYLYDVSSLYRQPASETILICLFTLARACIEYWCTCFRLFHVCTIRLSLLGLKPPWSRWQGYWSLHVSPISCIEFVRNFFHQIFLPWLINGHCTQFEVLPEKVWHYSFLHITRIQPNSYF